MTEQKIKSGSKTNKNKIVIIVLALVILAGIAAFIYFFMMPDGYTTVNKTGDVLSNKTIEVTFSTAQTIDHITGYEMDSNYVYVSLLYNVKNISGSDITWKKFPYINIMQYNQKGGTYTQVKNSEAEFDFNALQSYAMQQGIDYTDVKENMAAGETRIDADIIKIPKEVFDTNKFFITIDNIDAIVQIEDNRIS